MHHVGLEYSLFAYTIDHEHLYLPTTVVAKEKYITNKKRDKKITIIYNTQFEIKPLN